MNEERQFTSNSIIYYNKNVFSSMTIFAEANVDVDLRMLRSFRVLRPLKLVSRIPSKHQAIGFGYPVFFLF